MNTAMTDEQSMDSRHQRLEAVRLDHNRLHARATETRVRRDLNASASAFLVLVITALASTELSAQAPIDPAEPDEATRAPSGEPWRGTLQNGAQVWVDPRTNRPMTNGPGYQTQLWDGVHRLNDGTDLHVRNGRVVPNAEMLKRRQATPTPSPEPEARGSTETDIAPPGATASPKTSGGRPCQVLVDQACGPDNACADTTKCSAARQLVDMAAEQRARQADPKTLNGTEIKCREALRDSFFAPCRPSVSGKEDSAPSRPQP